MQRHKTKKKRQKTTQYCGINSMPWNAAKYSLNRNKLEMLML